MHVSRVIIKDNNIITSYNDRIMENWFEKNYLREGFKVLKNY